MDPALYIDVSKIADANRDVYFETFFMAGTISASRRVVVVSVHSNDSCPSHDAVGGLFDGNAPRRCAGVLFS